MRTIRLLVFSLLIAIATMGIAVTASADDGGRTLTTTLSGTADASTMGDLDGSGMATIRVNPGQEEVCFTLTVSDIAPATAAHIHAGPAGTAGPIVISLTAPTGGSSSGCVAADRDLAMAILKHPANYYVNVHNAEYPAGAVRGQLAK